jgi:predicted TIM-barrel fold metal-dependent hydrolase
MGRAFEGLGHSVTGGWEHTLTLASGILVRSGRRAPEEVLELEGGPVPTIRIVDADTHILEPPDIWANWLPAQYRDQAPQLVKDHEDGDAWLYAGSSEPDPIGLTATPGKPFDEFRWTGVTYDEARPGCYNGAERLKDMDLDGIDTALIFPPQRTIGHFLGDEDDDFVRAGIDAYNNFLFEEFCAPDRRRLVGLAEMPSTGIDDAVDSLRKAAARGFKGVIISCWPSGKDSLSDEDDAFWAAAVDAGMPVAIHINIISRAARQASRKTAVAQAAASSTADTDAATNGNKARGERYGGSTRANAKAVGGLASVFSMVPGTVSQLIFTGTFERFPELHIAMIETGIGWIAHFLEQMDDRYWRNRSWGQVPITEPPSYYWHRNFSASFITDRAGIATRHAVGVENVMWSTDYPHHGNDWPYSRKTIEEMMGHIPQAEKALVIGGNAARIFGLD